MTAGELGARMSSAELTNWIAHDSLTAAEREHEARMADQRSLSRS